MRIPHVVRNGGIAAALALCVALGCIRKQAPKVPLQLTLYSGIGKIARLGDPASHVQANTLFKPSHDSILASSDLGQLGFTDVLTFDEIGTRVFIRHEMVAMIQIQAPFAGTVEGNTQKAFPEEPFVGKTWEETLQAQFGIPRAKGSGGRLGSSAFFYSWGDVSYNKLGPNQFAIYQAPDIATFRQKNFGQEISLFKSN